MTSAKFSLLFALVSNLILGYFVCTSWTGWLIGTLIGLLIMTLWYRHTGEL